MLATCAGFEMLGVRIAMDDFGTGYSSLSYLPAFPFDKIKIDQSFVRDLSRKGDSLAIIKAIIGLGHSLGMAMTAEGVETEEQLNAVREQGCNEVQGFLFSPPMPPAAVQVLLEATGGRGFWPIRGLPRGQPPPAATCCRSAPAPEPLSPSHSPSLGKSLPMNAANASL